MRIVIIGRSGSGKSTLSKKIAEITHYPLLHLDSIWHTTDYSNHAKDWFSEYQKEFMQQDNWIIDGNYGGTFSNRLPQADVIIWLKINKYKAVYRVIKRSLDYHMDQNNRSEMPQQFSEHFDHDYWDFLKFVYSYDDKNTAKLINKYKSTNSKLVILKK